MTPGGPPQAPERPLNVVVTGGAGFIGANLCRALSGREGFGPVVALDDLSTGHRSNLDGVGGVELVEGSILDARLLDEVVGPADAVVHLAARPSVARSIEDPLASHLTNATGTVAVLEAARRGGRPHVVVASSSSVYGANPALPKREDMAARPVSPYAASKLAAESYALAYGASFGLPVLAFRFFNVFGPLQGADHAYAAVVPAFISAALAGRAAHHPRRRDPDPGLHLRGHGGGRPGRGAAPPGDPSDPGQPGLRLPGLAAGAGRHPGDGPRPAPPPPPRPPATGGRPGLAGRPVRPREPLRRPRPGDASSRASGLTVDWFGGA